VKSDGRNIKKKDLIEKLDYLKENIEQKKKRIKKLNQLSRAYSTDNRKHLEIEKISKFGIWKIELPDLEAEWSDELYNLFEIEKSKVKLSFSTFLEFIHPNDRDSVQRELELALNTKSDINIKHRIVTPNGSIKILHVRGKVYFDKDDVPFEVLGATQDITELVDVETTKWEKEENFTSIFKNSPAALAITTIEDGRIREVNESFCELVELPKSDLIDKKTTDIKLWTDLKTRTEFANTLKTTGRVKNLESKALAKSGEERTVLLSAELIKYDNEQHILTTVVDITERLLTEEALKISEARFKTVSNLTSDFSYAFSITEDGELNFEWVGGALKKITGYTTEELAQKGGWEVLIYPDDTKITHEQYKILINGKSSTVEYRIIDRKGKVRWVRDYATPSINELTGKVDSIYGAMQDITDNRFANEKIKFLNRILRTISEINQLIVREPNRDIVLSETCKILVEHGKFPMAWIGLVDNGSKIYPAAQYGFPENYLTALEINVEKGSTNTSLMGTAIRKDEDIICYDICKDNRFPVLKRNAEKLGFNASAAFPLRINKKVVGAINISLISTGKFPAACSEKEIYL